MAGSLILDITYEIDVRSAEDPYLVMGGNSLKTSEEASIPGSFLVDALPIRRFRSFRRLIC
jgi:hypothetical protein